MGGRGAGSGARSSPPFYLGETEKAVKLKIGIDYYDMEKTKEYDVWVPKSQLAADGRPGEWISNAKVQDTDKIGRQFGGRGFLYWKDAQGRTFQPSKTTNEIQAEKKRKKAFEAGQKSYNDLVEQAKKMGVKGVRVGMKRKTIESKIRNFGK